MGGLGGGGSVNVMFSCVTVDALLMIPCRGVTCSDWGEGGWVGCGGGSVNVMFQLRHS